jgi:hypothetical protein
VSDDARRELQQRALKNVRGLVDKIEHDDAVDRRAQKRIYIGIVVGAVLVAVALGLLLTRSSSGTRSIDLSPAPAAATPKPGQVMPQAPRAPQ